MARRHKGFTLVELVVTVLVLAIALAVALPAFGALRERFAAMNTFHALTTALMTARMAAITHGRPVTLCPSADGLTCRLDLRWDQGWIVYRDPGRTPQPADAGAILWVELRAPGPVAVRSSVGRHRVRYQPSGFSGGNNLSLRACSLRGARLLGAVVVNVGGRARVEWAREGQNTPCPYAP
ncbi:GspH/FimT family pseudopilin [bacterium BD-1]|uniref:GspH/FimT family pseudopilin n=1 Tax=Arenimonas sp. TaxID=1872635 RepID=UPI0035B08A6C|nr:GspH/FimT family pseudopilin [Ottowia caeni]